MRKDRWHGGEDATASKSLSSNKEEKVRQTGTCIVGLESDGVVYIGGDSAGVDGWLGRSIRVDEKVFIKNRMIFGFTSSFRMGQLLRYTFNPPKQAIGQDDFEYLCGPWMESLVKCLKDKGYAKVDKNEVSGGIFLLGFNSKLYRIEGDFQVGRRVEPYDACGCAERYALGAMALLVNRHIGPEEKIREALGIAEKFSAGVKGPFVILKLEKERK